MMKIVEKENFIIDHMKKAKSEGGKIYCLGARQMGNLIKTAAELYGIVIDAFLVSKKYFKEGDSFEGIPVFCLEELSKSNTFSAKDLMIIAFRNCDNGMINRYRNELSICDEDIFSFFAVDNEIILDYDFFSAHKEEFELLYQELADDKSRDCMDAYLNQKISGKFSYLDKVYDDGQYYDDRIVDFKNIESFVDCGAYDGDSYLAFREAYRLNTGKEYKGAAYLLEPDEYNYQKMIVNCSHAGNGNSFLQCGAWNKTDKLIFSSGGDTSSGINESGKVSIDVDSIDHIMQGKRVDFIKMDIEGAELNALKGAGKTIEAYKPILAVCVYHRRDDLITIPAYIRSICPQYHFYIRAYSRYAQELVLYAVCESRI